MSNDSDHVYKKVEITRTSTTSSDDAISRAIAKGVLECAQYPLVRGRRNARLCGESARWRAGK